RERTLASLCPEIRRPGEFLPTLRRSKFTFAPRTLAFAACYSAKAVSAGASMPRIVSFQNARILETNSVDLRSPRRLG
ncbi:MAG: hypothetical protein V3T15_06000, partial [Pseudomonadales bacterium]